MPCYCGPSLVVSVALSASRCSQIFVKIIPNYCKIIIATIFHRELLGLGLGVSARDEILSSEKLDVSFELVDERVIRP